MREIDKPISYNWTLSWDEDGFAAPPIVNRLLVAIMSKNVSEVRRLLNEGASLQILSEKPFVESFGRVMYEADVIANYDLIKLLTEHRFNRLWFGSFDTYDRTGYRTSVVARAYLVEKSNHTEKRVTKLLLQNGFPLGFYRINGTSPQLVKEIDACGDVDIVQYCMECGAYEDEFWRCNNEAILSYLAGYKRYIKRITYWMAFTAETGPWTEIVPPEMGKYHIFNKKRVKEQYEIDMRDYADRLEIQKKWIASLDVEDRKKISEKETATVQFQKILSTMSPTELRNALRG